MFVVSAGFKTIWVDLLRFCWILIICCWSESILYDFHDLADWGGFGSIWGCLVNLIGQFGLVNLIEFALFLLWIRAVWVNLDGFQ